jgi:hypothetical protein
MTTTPSTREARAGFEAAFLDLLCQRVHPEYRRDPRSKGYFVDFTRTTPEGLILSYNLVRVRLDYSLCFSVLLAAHTPAGLLSPLTFGSRFDRNNTLSRQFELDLHLRRGDPGYPAYLWSSGTPRSNTLEIVARAIDAPERQLYPVYREAIRLGKFRLINLITHASRLLEQITALGLPPDSDHQAVAAALGIDKEELNSFGPLLGCAVGGLAIARGGSHWSGFGPATNTVDLDVVPLDVLALVNLPAFRTSQVPLAMIVQRLQAL